MWASNSVSCGSIGAAEPPSQHLEAEPLAGLDRHLVIVVGLVDRLADDDARRRQRLGRLAGVVVGLLHYLRQIVHTKDPQIRQTLGGRQAQAWKPIGASLGTSRWTSSLAGSLPLLLSGGIIDLARKIGPESGRLGQVLAGEGEVDGRAALDAVRRDGFQNGRRRIRLGRLRLRQAGTAAARATATATRRREKRGCMSVLAKQDGERGRVMHPSVASRVASAPGVWR